MGTVKHPLTTLARLAHENFLWLLLGTYALAAFAPGPGLVLASVALAGSVGGRCFSWAGR